MKFPVQVGVLLAVLPLAASAIEPGPSSYNQKETENWLQLQVSGSVRSPVDQVATAPERERSLQRWLDSYSHPVPEFYGQDEGGKTKTN
ncbi:DUF3613 domain-containing protein [Pseudomonas sp.]|uniref:DUF3613 domain-containing protein n=1 Tax=Pseudomonas sp. TaxID=306 RepID=UPI00261AB7B1|nr:DUF3613 domain-containing protein [Pseudomonas sp.]